MQNFYRLLNQLLCFFENIDDKLFILCKITAKLKISFATIIDNGTSFEVNGMYKYFGVYCIFN
jgi:hypothetical protein